MRKLAEKKKTKKKNSNLTILWNLQMKIFFEPKYKFSIWIISFVLPHTYTKIRIKKQLMTKKSVQGFLRILWEELKNPKEKIGLKAKNWWWKIREREKRRYLWGDHRKLAYNLFIILLFLHLLYSFSVCSSIFTFS